eukprot:m.12450 g.12450  ORF g.12450 m.12450 type:complete len:70 (-) comp2947_c0_seq1:2281-2490(-)
MILPPSTSSPPLRGAQYPRGRVSRTTVMLRTKPPSVSVSICEVACGEKNATCVQGHMSVCSVPEIGPCR